MGFHAQVAQFLMIEVVLQFLLQMLAERILEGTLLTGAELRCASSDSFSEIFEYLRCEGLSIFSQQYEVELMLLGEV